MTDKRKEEKKRSLPARLARSLYLALAFLPFLAVHAAGKIWRKLRGDEGSRFPESERRLVQLLLLLAGLVPMWRSLLVSRLRRRRRERVRTARQPSARFASFKRRLHPVLYMLCASSAAAVAIFFSLYTMGTTVTYNGQTLDIVQSPDEAQQVAMRVEGITASALGSFSFEDDSLSYEVGLVPRSEIGESAELERDLTEELGLVTYGYSLYVDGELIGSTEYAGALEELIEQIRIANTTENTLSVDFVEDLDIREGYVPTESLVNLGYIAQVLNSTKSGEVSYTVVSGDTWSEIANSHGLSSAQLEAMNPGYDIDWLNIGDVLILSNAVSYLTVVTTERESYVADIPFETTYVDDGSMYVGETRVISQGASGTANVVDNVVYVNGVESERTTLSSVTITEPVTEVRARGTKERPSWLASGHFSWPASGHISSYFGRRNTGIRGASTNHMGIDIACPYGAPIYAADGGTVSFTGYKGAMGYVVIVDHGNGFVTYYQHCSKMLVSAGQHVYKGQQIAKVGSSGVSSGPHCHFGIQKNGSYVDPLRYL